MKTEKDIFTWVTYYKMTERSALSEASFIEDIPKKTQENMGRFRFNISPSANMSAISFGNETYGDNLRLLTTGRKEDRYTRSLYEETCAIASVRKLQDL